MALDQAEAIRLLNAKWGKVAYPAVTGRTLRLMSANGTSTTNGTQVANAGGSAYAEQDIAGAMPGTAVADSGSGGARMASNAAITFTNMPTGNVVGVEVWAGPSGSARRSDFGPLAVAKATALGDSLTIAASNLVNVLSAAT